MTKQPKKLCGIAVHFDGWEAVKVRDLTPNPNNENEHSPKQVELVADSIKANGWRKPIVVSSSSGQIVEGHGRRLAAMRLGLASVPVEVRTFESSEDEARWRVSDNATSQAGKLSAKAIEETLRTELEELTEANLRGWGLNEVSMDKIKSDLADSIAQEIEAEPEHTEEHAQKENRTEQLIDKIKRLAKAKPEALENAQAVIMSAKHHEVLVLDDPALGDVIKELRRYHDNGEPSPLAELLNKVHRI